MTLVQNAIWVVVDGKRRPRDYSTNYDLAGPFTDNGDGTWSADVNTW